MASLTKPYTFAAGSYAVAAQVNADLDTLYDWANGGGAMWADGTVAFTAVPTGPNADPTSPNHLTRKQYVDGRAPANLLLNNATAASGLRVMADSTVVTTNAGGGATVAFPSAFPNGLITVVACLGDWTTDPAPSVQVIWSSGTGPSGFNLHVDYNGAALANSTVRVNWIAVGS